MLSLDGDAVARAGRGWATSKSCHSENYCQLANVIIDVNKLTHHLNRTHPTQQKRGEIAILDYDAAATWLTGHEALFKVFDGMIHTLFSTVKADEQLVSI